MCARNITIFLITLSHVLFGVNIDEVYNLLDEQRAKIKDIRCLRVFQNTPLEKELIVRITMKGADILKMEDLSLDGNIVYKDKNYTYIKRKDGGITTNKNDNALFSGFESPVNFDMRSLRKYFKVDKIDQREDKWVVHLSYSSSAIPIVYNFIINRKKGVIEEVKYFRSNILTSDIHYTISQFQSGIYYNSIITVVSYINQNELRSAFIFKNVEINKGIPDNEFSF